MTRINANIPVKNLTDQHLLAEHREIKRIPALLKERLINNNDIGYIPNNFTLGTGHMSFFLNKGLFTLKRYTALYNECVNRGFNVTDYQLNWTVYKSKKGSWLYLKDWLPTDNDNQLIRDRITERLTNSKQIPRYFGKSISVEEAIQLIRS